MNRSFFVSATGAVLALAVALSAAGPSAAQPPPVVPFGQGTHAFRRILTDLELQPVEGLKAIDDPKRTLIVVLGETDNLDEVPDGIDGFVGNGGALLIATDRPTSSVLQKAFGVVVNPVTVSRPDDATRNFTYREREDFPLVFPAAGGDNLLFRRPPLPGLRPRLERVATNRPACLSLPGKTLTVAASLPTHCRFTTLGRVWFVIDPRVPQPFAARGEVGAGRVLVLADHSMFINDLLLQQDNDNIDFTYNCLDWLLEGKPRRDRVVFIEEGIVKTNLDVPLQDLPSVRPPWNMIPPLVNGVVAGMETPDEEGKTVLGEAMASVEQRGQGTVLLAGIAGTLLFAFYGLYRISSGRFRPEHGVPLLPTALARQQVQRDALEQRRRALLAAGNLWEAARGLSRTAFEGSGIPAGEREPRFSVEGGGWFGWTLPARARRLWQLAYGDRPVRVTRAEFAALPQRIAEVRAALAAGTLRISN